MTPYKIVKRLTMTKKPEIQKEILLEAWQTCDEFFVGVSMSADQDTKVVLEKIIEISPGEPENPPFTFQEFVGLYDKITQIDCDPNEAREATIDAAMRCDANEWNQFYRRILLKKLHDDLPKEIIQQTLIELTGYNPML